MNKLIVRAKASCSVCGEKIKRQKTFKVESKDKNCALYEALRRHGIFQETVATPAWVKSGFFKNEIETYSLGGNCKHIQQQRIISKATQKGVGLIKNIL